MGAVFVATPPLESLRGGFQPGYELGSDTEIRSEILDVSRAHPHGVIMRNVFIRLAQDGPRSQEEDICGVLFSLVCEVRAPTQ